MRHRDVLHVPGAEGTDDRPEIGFVYWANQAPTSRA